MTKKGARAADKNAKKNKRLSLNKKTLKDLNAKGQGPVGGGILRCTAGDSGCN